MTLMRYSFSCLLIAFAPFAIAAEESLPAGTKVAVLAANPAKVSLNGPFEYAQLTVTATLESGEAVDATRLAKIAYPDFVKATPTGLVRPNANGSGTIRIELGNSRIDIPLTVTLPTKPVEIGFVKDVQPVLSKLGCNMGTCHGSAQGKNGFKLSLRGYDPIYDHRAFTDDLEGRRFNRAAPERSLMLMKPAGAVPHAGGVVWQPGDPNYELVKQWIAQGVKLDLQSPKPKSIEVFPKSITVGAIGSKQQFAVVATYPDGRAKDVSAEAFIESSNTEVATIDKAGLLTTVRRGESTLLARYEGTYAAAGVVVMGDRSGFQWQPRPVHNEIDSLVDAKLQKMKIQAGELCTDEEFLRRAYLDLTGLPPTSNEVRRFLADTKPSKAKREETIARLIGSDAFIDHWTNKWGDLLQVNRKFLGDKGASALRGWIRDAVATNMPYDRFAYEILAASGSTVKNPPTAYYKVLRTPDLVMENTTQLFLAVRFNCNKCHDHPFEKWTQDQYYELAAFFAQVDRKEDPAYKGQKIGGSAVEGAKPLVETIEDAKAGEIKHDRTGQNQPPKFPYEHKGGLPDPKLSRRQQAAKWITSKDNPYFAKSYVNRIWSYLTGTGIIEPVDDIRAGNPPSNPELLDKLTNDFIASGFDTRKLIKEICESRTYQLSINTNKWNKDDDLNYSHALPRRLPAEVLFDAIHRATGAASKLPGLPAGSRAAQLVDGNVELPGGFLELFGKPVRESACECERSNTMMLGPVLAMVNGPIVGDAIKDPANHIVQFTEKEKDDAKVVEEIYLSVLNRRPTADEIQTGKAALAGSAKDFEALKAEYAKRRKAFDDYAATIDGKLPAYEQRLRSRKPTAWTVIEPKKAESKGGPTPATATKEDGSTLTINKDGSISAAGKAAAVDTYTITGDVKLPGTITALRLEVLADDTLPARGPGRAPNGNFVLTELALQSKPAAKADEKPKPVKLSGAQATAAQANFPAANAIDNNRATGWAISPKFGENNAALFKTAAVNAKDGVTLTVNLAQEFGTVHLLGRFRLSVTTDADPKLASPLAADVVRILDTPANDRTKEQLAKLKAMMIADDAEYQQLQREIPTAPPADARVLGAQDLVWALMNTSAFLFNR
jgi:hypothetical protein